MGCRPRFPDYHVTRLRTWVGINGRHARQCIVKAYPRARYIQRLSIRRTSDLFFTVVVQTLMQRPRRRLLSVSYGLPMRLKVFCQRRFFLDRGGDYIDRLGGNPLYGCFEDEDLSSAYCQTERGADGALSSINSGLQTSRCIRLRESTSH